MIKYITLLLFGFTAFGQSNDDYKHQKKIIESYYRHYNSWDFDKLFTLYHPTLFENMKTAMIQSGSKLDDNIDFKEHFKSMILKGMKMRYKTKNDYIRNNSHKILNYEVNQIEDSGQIKDPLQIIVEVSGKSNGKSYKGKMIFILHKDKGQYKIVDMGKYEIYQKLLKKQLEEDGKNP